MCSLNSLLDFTKICRLCLSQDRPLSQIFCDDDNIEIPLSSVSSKILACVGIETHPGDNLPEKICNMCLEQLENWIKFKELCDNTNTLLLQCSAEIPPLTDEVPSNNLKDNSENLHKPESLSGHSVVDVSLLNHHSLFLKVNDSIQEDSISESLVDPLSHEQIDGLQNRVTHKEESQQQEEDEIKILWEEKDVNVSSKSVCGVCPQVFTRLNSIMQHNGVDHKNIASEEVCTNCGKLFISNDRLGTRFVIKHKDEIYECQIFILRNVSEKPHNLKQSVKFVCKVCSAVMSTNSDLQDHMSEHTRDKLYSCGVCQKSFKNVQSLQQHLKDHNNDKSPDFFQCHMCSGKFKTEEFLTAHKLSHKKENSHICEYCGRIYRYASQLLIHKATHEPKEVELKCRTCNEEFTTKPALAEHMLTHENPEYPCPICNKIFKMRGKLLTHIYKVHESYPEVYVCEDCGRRFSEKRYLKRHVVKVHSQKTDN